MRILFLLQICFMVLHAEDVSVLSPPKVTLDSNNFKHVLHLTPALNTTSGTIYWVKIRNGGCGAEVKKPRSKVWMFHTNATLIDVSRYMMDIYVDYAVRVWASLGSGSSSVNCFKFTPFEDTVLGPPSVLLVGCGDCLNISVSLQKEAALINNSEAKQFYNSFLFDIHWRKKGDEKVEVMQNHHHHSIQHSGSQVSYTYELSHLQRGQEYCVQAHLNIVSNSNGVPSGWTCNITSRPSSRGVGYLAGWSAGSALLGAAVLTIIAVLVYTRALCKPNTPLPRALVGLVPAWVNSPEVAAVSEMEMMGSRSRTSGQKDVAAPPPGRPQQQEGAAEYRNFNDDDDDDDEDEDEDEYSSFNHMGNLARPNAAREEPVCQHADGSGERSPGRFQNSSNLPQPLRDESPVAASSLTNVEVHSEEKGAVPVRQQGFGVGLTNIDLSSVTVKSLQVQNKDVEGKHESDDEEKVHKPLLTPQPLHTDLHKELQPRTPTAQKKLQDFITLGSSCTEQTDECDLTHTQVQSEDQRLLGEEEEEEDEEEEDEEDYASGYMAR